MTNRRSGLGRGLDALIPSLQPVVEQVDIDLIAPNPHQPRSVFDPSRWRSWRIAFESTA